MEQVRRNRTNGRNGKQRQHRKKRKTQGLIFLQSLMIAAGMMMIAYILVISLRRIHPEEPVGEVIRLQDALILTEALNPLFCEDSRYRELQEKWEGQRQVSETNVQETETEKKTEREIEEETDGEISGAKDGALSYGDFLLLEDLFREAEPAGLSELEQLWDGFEEKYEVSHAMLRDDWYICYDMLVQGMGQEHAITMKEVLIAGIGGQVLDAEGLPLPEDQLLTDQGVYLYRSDRFEDCSYQPVLAVQKDGILLTVREMPGGEWFCPNLWIMETEQDRLQVFWYDHSTWIPYGKMEGVSREQISDLHFCNGILEEVRQKKEKINGRLLRVKEDTLELEGQGTYQIAEDFKIYRLYDHLEELDRENLAVGYDFTDFVIEEDRICAGLVSRRENMKNIRVLLRTEQFAGMYHEEARVTSDTGFLITYGSYEDQKQEELPAGEELVITQDSSYLEGGRLLLTPMALTGNIEICSMQRSQGAPVYRGQLEILKEEEGLVLINELPLEEYLYSVVPSEMPASYPLEALKAQAVCARTYAYRYLLRPGMAAYGAHVDDSSGYQVYNNISENSNTTHAVRETAGRLLYFGEELCGTYYYSTSCGFGTDTRIWKSGGGEETYLQARRIREAESSQDERFTASTLQEEAVFREFISQSFSEDFESSEPWYRWSYTPEYLDPERILSVLQQRYQAAPEMILTRDSNGDFISREVKNLGELTEIRIDRRGPGGVADELLIAGTECTYKVISEYNIRCVLNDGTSKVLRQDGSEAASPNLLPSAYISIDTEAEEGKITDLRITGGGFGHGAGMSQNGARAMADSGMTAEEILLFFYQSCDIRSEEAVDVGEAKEG